MIDKVKGNGKSYKILLGLGLIIFAIYLILHTAGVGFSGLKTVSIEGVNVISVPNAPITLDNNNKLVHTSGAPIINIVIDDPLLGFSERAVKIIRKVEMYQWTQTLDSKNEKLANSIDKETVVYTYKPTWSSDLIDSNSFKDKINYKNPLTMPVDGLIRKVQDVAVGDFHLSSTLIDLINDQTQVDLSKLDIDQLQQRSKAKVFHDGQFIFVGDDVNHPAIGNLRISLFKVAPSALSIIAQQKDNNLDVMALPDGKNIAIIVPEIESAKEMLGKSIFNVWIFYFISLFMLFFGVFAIFSENTLFSKIDNVISSIGIYASSLLVALIIWSLVMMIAQYFVHFWVSVLCLFLFAGLIYLQKRLTRA